MDAASRQRGNRIDGKGPKGSVNPLKDRRTGSLAEQPP
jgi:hypothetical protein